MGNLQTHEKTMTARQQRRVVAAACMGNYLEWFDFGIYAYFAVVIGRLFFPAGNEAVSTLVSFSVFAVGFIMRPLGSLIIGGYGDRHGRKNAMLLTIVCMGLGSGIIAFAPTYASIGIAAPILIILGRLFQGFSTGGEIGASTAILMESAGEERRGFFVSWQYITQGLASVTSAGFGAALFWLLDSEQIYSWGWRIPFIFSLVIIPVGLYIRANVDETLAEDEKHTGEHHPIREIIARYPRNFIAAIGMIIPGTTMVYMVLKYTPTYMQTVSTVNPGMIYAMTMVASVMNVLGYLSGGLLYDRLTSRKIVPMICYSLAAGLMTLMIFSTGQPAVFFTLLLITPFFTGIATPIGTTLVAEAFPPHVRTTAVAVSYSTGVAVFGGTTPMIISALMSASSNNPLSPLIWLLPVVALGVLSYMLFDEKPRRAKTHETENEVLGWS